MLPAMDFLLEHLERATEATYRGNEFMEDRVFAAWRKLNEYYNKADDVVVYMAATMLNPLQKWVYFEDP